MELAAPVRLRRPRPREAILARDKKDSGPGPGHPDASLRYLADFPAAKGGGRVAELGIVELTLPNKATVFARVTELEVSGASKVAFGNRFDFADVARTLEGVATALHAAIAKAGPRKVTVTLGLELAVKSGKLTGLIVEGEGKGTFEIALEWELGD